METPNRHSMSDSDNDDQSDDVYVINRISGLKKYNAKRYFLIEWEGYHITENTWEEETNVFSEAAILKFYREYEKLKNIHIKNLRKTNGRWLLNDTYDPSTKNFSPVTPKSSSVTTQNDQVTGHVPKRYADDYLEHRITKTMKNNYFILDAYDSKIVKTNNEPYSFLDVSQSRNNNVSTTKSVYQIRYHIADSTNQAPVYYFNGLDVPVTIVNEIDVNSGEPVLPDDFMYITDLVYTSPVQSPKPEFLTACFCSETSYCTDGCHEDNYAYDENGLLALSSRCAIYECTAACLCNDHCKNRVVQRGRTMPLEIFKTDRKGWGVRTKVPISRGMFIEQYVGEVLTMEEADRRSELNCHYLFEMDFAQDEFPTKYVIDAHRMGNVSRLFNHSCSPNMEVIAVNYDSVEVEMHRIAFFALTDIAKNEELCFDYNGFVEPEDENPDRDYYQCKCGAYNCRGSIYI